MAMLGTWAYRLSLTIDSTKIDATLTDFPVLVKLSTASGIGDVDVSAVFDELTSDANEEAWLHVKVPSVSSSADTILYLYYDSSQPDNTAYIGDTTDAVTHNVWDSNFEAVYHMAQDPNGDVADAIKDSTGNANDGTPSGSMTTADLVSGQVGDGIDFDGSDDFVVISDSNSLDITSEITLEIVAKTDDISTDARTYLSKRNLTNRQNYALRMGYSVGAPFQGIDHLDFVYDCRDDSGDAHTYESDSNIITTGSYQFFAFSFTYGTAGSASIYLNGVSSSGSWITGDGTETPAASSADLAIGRMRASVAGGETDGTVDEVRISSSVRSAAWIKATYNSLWDSLVTFGGGTPADTSESLSTTDVFEIDTPYRSLPEGVGLSDTITVFSESYTNEYSAIRSNWYKRSGKWYFEVVIEQGGYHWVGIGTDLAGLSEPVGGDLFGWGYGSDGKKYHGGSVGYAFGGTYGPGDVIGVAFDMATRKVWFSKNGAWQNSGDPVAGTGEAFSGIGDKIFAIWASYDTV